MKTFKDLEFAEHPVHPNGIKAYLQFENNYAASVIRSDYSYGGNEGLYELAVIKIDGDDWMICYDTPITDDVLGYLTESEVTEAMIKIQKL